VTSDDADSARTTAIPTLPVAPVTTTRIGSTSRRGPGP
jgi:hypothetical protein